MTEEKPIGDELLADAWHDVERQYLTDRLKAYLRQSASGAWPGQRATSMLEEFTRLEQGGAIIETQDGEKFDIALQ